MRKPLLGACVATVCWMSEAGATYACDGRCGMVTGWELDNKTDLSGELKYLHIDCCNTEQKLKE